MNIVYCIDQNYNKQCYVSIKSIIDQHKEKINFYVLHNNSKTFSTEVITKNTKNKNYDIKIIDFFDSDLLGKSDEELNLKISHITKATLYRLFLSNYLYDSIEEIVYLDADVLCLKNFYNDYLEVFKEMKKNRYAIAAHTIGTAEGNKEILDSLKLINGKYFNAGVVFIDYKEWKEREIESKLQKMLFSKKFKYLDQDILNKFFDGDYYEMSPTLNFLLRPVEGSQEIKEKFINDKAKLIHYFGKNKPWDLKYIMEKNSSYYQNIYQKLFNNRYHATSKNKIELVKYYMSSLRK